MPNIPNSLPLGTSKQIPAKFPIGKVDTSLPENYDAFRVLDPDTNSPDGQIYLTTLPPRYVGQTLANNPDGWAECLFYLTQQKRGIISTPGFPSLIARPPQVRHRIGPSRFGNGMFATRDIKMGELVMSERPLLISPIHTPQPHRRSLKE